MNFLFLAFAFMTSLSMADISQCALIFEQNEVIELSKFEQELRPEFREEWAYVREVLQSKEISYSIERTQEDPVIVFSPTGKHNINQLAKIFRDKYGAKLIYEVGIGHPEFQREFTRDGAVANLYIHIPASYIGLPMGLGRTYGMLHEARHLVGFLQAYSGVDSPYYGYILSKDGSALPTRPPRLEETKGIWGFLGRLKKKSNPDRERMEDIYKEVSVDELRTYISTIYQQALRISARLKMNDMSPIELKERIEQIITDIQTAEFIANKIDYNLEHVIAALKDITFVITSATTLNDRTLHTANIPYTIEGKEAFYQTQLPMLKNADSISETFRHTERQVKWSQQVASEVLASLRPLVSTKDPASFTPQEARQYIDQVLESTKPSHRRQWEQLPH